VNNCGRCHECESRLDEELDGEQFCPRCEKWRRYRSHGWKGLNSDLSMCSPLSNPLVSLSRKESPAMTTCAICGEELKGTEVVCDCTHDHKAELLAPTYEIVCTCCGECFPQGGHHDCNLGKKVKALEARIEQLEREARR
jgi:hypothetical protein